MTGQGGRHLDDYQALLSRKRVAFEPRGFEPSALPSGMHPHQAHATDFAIRQGCAGLFLDTGLGKTYAALEWGRQVVERTNKPVLMLAPLAVSSQHQAEAKRRKIDAKAIRDASEIKKARIYVTNYERLPRLDPSIFGGVIIDESGILKSFTGSTSRKLISSFQQTPYRLACTATPAPNDHMELGQHSAFLGAMAANEMLSRWFIADQQDMGRYRLKRGAIADFWDWVASWSRAIAKPSDIGFSDDGFVLPPLDIQRTIVRADLTQDTGGMLFRIPDTSATSIHKEKRRSIADRADVVANVVGAKPKEPWVIWCDTDYEADEIAQRIPEALEVRGSMSAELKEERLVAFSEGQARIILTKPRIAGYGLNWQHCSNMAFAGLSFSYEAFYQAVRRCWRFGQKRPVTAHIAMADTERAIYDAITRKRGDHDVMKTQMTAAMARAARVSGVFESYRPEKHAPLPTWIRPAA